MTSIGLLQRIDDRINPIVVKELRQAVQSRFVAWVILLFLVLQLLYIGIHLFVLAAQGRTESIEGSEGLQVFTVLQGILLTTCMLFLPIYTGVRLAAERSELNTDLLFITTLKPRSIISGKLVSAVVLALLIFSACAPFMLFTFFLRGIDLPSILFVLGIDFLAVIGSVQLMVFLAVVDTNWPLKILLGLVGLFWLVVIFWMAFVGTMVLLERGITPLLDQEGFWLSVAAMVLGIVGLCGLFFTWSVALVSPPTSNRAWPVRLYLFVFWLVSGVAMTYIAYKVRVEAPFALWLSVMSVVWGLQLIIAVNERQHWSPRVRTAIPRFWPLRLPAFLLFSGSAGGVLFASLMMGLTALAYYLFRLFSAVYAWFPHGIGTERMDAMFETFAVVFAYCFCYCLSAVFLRELFFRRLTPGFTWLVLILLVGVATVLPLALSVLLYFRNWHYDAQYLWLLANPAVAITEFVERRNVDRRTIYWLFLAFWAGLATLVNVTWFFRQVLSFEPLPRDRPAPAPEEPLAAILVPEQSA